MADYYPLLAKAAAGLSNASPDARQAMYERARKALLGQLRNIDPPVADEDIARESEALDAAIARVEQDLFAAVPAKAAVAPLDVRAPIVAPETPKVPEPPVTVPTIPTPPVQPASPGPAVAPAPPRPVPPASITPSPPSASPPTPDEKPVAVEADVAAAEVEADDVGPPRTEDAAPASDLRVRSREPQRPLAPTPPEPKGRHKGVWILGAVVAVVVAAVAAAALKLRDSPEDLARLKPVAAPTAETASNGKIAERVGRDDSSLPASTPAPAKTSNAASGPATAPSAPAQSQPSVTQAPIPVAQRAALLVEAPDLESKVRTFLGSTVWRLDNVAASAGQPLGTAVHADVDVPEAKVRLALDFRKNTDPALPAASTIEVRFTLQPGSALPGISQISVPQMRREENPNGEALAGVPVKITDTYFLVGLAQGDFAAKNNDLIRSRNWIDIPIQLSDNRIAKITIEKGATGDRILADALTTWSQ